MCLLAQGVNICIEVEKSVSAAAPVQNPHRRQRDSSRRILGYKSGYGANFGGRRAKKKTHWISDKVLIFLLKGLVAGEGRAARSKIEAKS
jgi:hypothetical protein